MGVFMTINLSQKFNVYTELPYTCINATLMELCNSEVLIVWL